MVEDNNNVLKTGTFVHIVIERNERKELVEVRPSFIHLFSGNTLALAQTAPPLDSSYLGRTMLVTIVSNEGGKRVRYGFKADLERIEERGLSGGEDQKLLVFAMRSDMHLDNLRFFYRVHVPKDFIWADIDNQTVTITDLSYGGFRASWRSNKQVQPSDRVRVRLRIARAEFHVEAEVRWIEEGREQRHYFGAQFCNLDSKTRAELEKQVRQVERQIAARTSRLA